MPSQATHKPTFDPIEGCQIFSTGFLGAFFILALSINYALFKSNVLSSGGPEIVNVLQDSLVSYSKINRDFYDIMFIVLLGFLLMVLWEHLRHTITRSFSVLIALLGIGGSWKISQNAAWFFPEQTHWFLGWQWTRIEVVFALIAIGMLLIGVSTFLYSISKGQPIKLSPLKWAIKTSFYRWLSGLLFFSAVLVLTSYHPFYQVEYYVNWRIACAYLFWIYAILGWPYGLVTNLLRGHRFEERSDPCFVFMLIFKNLLSGGKNRNFVDFRRTITNRRILIALRDIFVKLFFIPLMIVFLYTEYGKLFKNIPEFLNSLEWTSTSFDLFYHSTLASFFIIDVSLGLIGYLCSSRWLRNKSKSVDSSLSGWMVALVCYPPFNSITHNYLPYSQSSGSPYAILQYEWIAILLKVITLLLFAIYVWATMAFGLRFSNLTNRGILTKGPYAWVRHPAYFCKNLAWWGESIRSFSSPGQFLFLAIWNVIYFLRAYTEERHLRQDPDYLAYCERVKYKFIPGVW